ncbi:hypothetical protein ACW14Y_42870 (plasmid) [Kitasatospora sp. cg17-2]
MEIISGSGLLGGPWTELMPDLRPVLVLPADPGRPLVPGDGWTGHDTALMPAAGPHPLWSAVLTGHRLTVHRPGGQVWFDGGITVTREWTRSVRAHRTLLLITGPFTSAFDFHPAAAAGRLLLLSTPIRLADAL